MRHKKIADDPKLKAPWLDSDWQCLLLAGLTAKEFKRFEKAGIPYSGSTGHCDPKYFPKTGPYIATFARMFAPSINALGWKAVKVTIESGQLVCRKSKTRSIDKI